MYDVVEVSYMHSKQKGLIGEIAIVKDLTEKGYFVFGEFGDLSRTDLIVLAGTRPIKVQVKARNSINGAVDVEIRKSGPGYEFYYSRDDVDVFAVYVLDRKLIAYISAKKLFENGTSTKLRIDKTKNNAVKNVNDFNDYLSFENAIK